MQHSLLSLRRTLMLVIGIILLSVMPALAAPAHIAPGQTDPSHRVQQAPQQLPAPVPAPVSVPSQPQIPALLSQPDMPLATYFYALVDQSGQRSIDEIADPAESGNFEQYKRTSVLTPKNSVTWLRFILQPLPDGSRPDLRLIDLGASVPGTPTLYTQSTTDLGQQEWKEKHPVHDSIFLLPETAKEPVVCYLRIGGTPGLYFFPVLRAASDSVLPQNTAAKAAGLAILATVLLICLFRGLSEPGFWRVWAFLYLCAAGAQFWFGLPSASSAISATNPFPAIPLLAPGVALFFLALTGAGLLRCGQTSRIIGFQYILLSFAGLALAVLPVLPGFAWIRKFAEFWPLGAALLLPTTLGACLCGIPGAFRFLLGCLVSAGSIVIAILGVKSGYAPELLSNIPLFGTALSSIIIIGLPQPGTTTPKNASFPVPDLAAAPGISAPAATANTDTPLTLSAPAQTLNLGAPTSLSFQTDTVQQPAATPNFQYNGLPGNQAPFTQMPAAPATPNYPQGASQQPMPAAGNSLDSILLADNQNTAFALIQLLQEGGCSVRCASSLQEMLAFFAQHRADILVIEGSAATPASRQALTAIKNLCHRNGTPVPVILALTADNSTWKDLGKAGFSHALTLPPDRETFFETIEDAREAARPQSAPQQGAPTPCESQPTQVSVPTVRQEASIDLSKGTENTLQPQEHLQAATGSQVTAPVSQASPNGSSLLEGSLEQAPQTSEDPMMSKAIAMARAIKNKYQAEDTQIAQRADLVIQAAEQGDRPAVSILLKELSTLIDKSNVTNSHL